MKIRYLANSLLILVLSLSPMGRATRMPVSDDPNQTQVFMPFIGNSIPLIVVHKHNFCSKTTSFFVRGDITSLVDLAFYDVILEAKAYDGEGQLLGTLLGHPIITATLTGQLNPFEIGFNANCADVVDSEVEVISWSRDSPLVYWPATLVYTSTVVSFGNGTWVTAEFRNDAGLPMQDVTGLAWSVHEKFSLGPLRHIADSLAPGETVTYIEFLDDVYGFAISTIEAAAQGVIEP